MPLLKTLRRKLRRHLPAAYAVYEESRLRRRLRRAPPVLIYQMSKVGSTSIKDSVVPRWPGLTVHTHDIAKDHAIRLDVKLVYEEVIRKGGPVLIISPVREPIGRVVSSFFETFGRHTGVQCNESSFSTDELMRIFWQRFGESRALTRSLTWFERRFYPIVDIDVYRYEFDSAGFQVIKHNNTSILLLRCELPDETKNGLLKSFLQLASFSLTNSNIGAQKDYAETYQSFKQSFVPPAWFLSKMYDSRYFTHFYAGQRDMWIARWTSKGAA